MKTIGFIVIGAVVILVLVCIIVKHRKNTKRMEEDAHNPKNDIRQEALVKKPETAKALDEDPKIQEAVKPEEIVLE